jgi:hypothetical protein
VKSVRSNIQEADGMGMGMGAEIGRMSSPIRRALATNIERSPIAYDDKLRGV